MRSSNNFSAFLKNSFFTFAIVLPLISFNGLTMADSRQNKKPPEAQKNDQDEPLRLNTDLIVLSVTVTDEAGKYAHGLKAKDFALAEDGVSQSIDSFSADRLRLLPESVSMPDTEQAKAA